MCTDGLLTFGEQTTHAVCADLDVEVAEFNGEVDHVHLLVHYPPTLAIPAPIHRLNGRQEFTGAGPRPTSPSPTEAHHRRSSSNTSTDKPVPLNAGLHPATNQMG